MCLWSCFLFFYNVYFWERERMRMRMSGGGVEREGDRIQSRLQALSHQHTAWCEAETHKPWDHDLSPSWLLNHLSHPGAPWVLSTIKDVIAGLHIALAYCHQNGATFLFLGNLPKITGNSVTSFHLKSPWVPEEGLSEASKEGESLPFVSIKC